MTYHLWWLVVAYDDWVILATPNRQHRLVHVVCFGGVRHVVVVIIRYYDDVVSDNAASCTKSGPDSQPILGYIGREHLLSRIYDHNTKYSNDHELYTDGADG